MKKKMKLKTIAILGLIVFFSYNYIRQENAMNRIGAEIAEKNEQLQLLKEQTQRLEDEVERSKTDQYIEELARTRLKMIKPGEKIVNDK